MSFVASIPVTNHHNLLRPISGRVFTTHHHGPDVEFVLDDRRSFSLLLDEALQLVKAAGPNLRNRLLVYDGHQVLVAEDDAE